MANIRSFTLKNSLGIIWDLNESDSFFTDIGDMGHERDFDYEVVGNYYIEISNELKQSAPSGTIVFNSYQTCNNFIKFIQSVPLALSYTMPGVTDTYFIDVKVSKFDKGEMQAGSVPVDIEFIGIGQYYKLVTVENILSSAVGKVYPYIYDYTYSDNTSGTVTIESDTNLDSPTKITIFGPCSNPSWTHYVNDVIQTTGKVNCDVSTGERLVIDSTSIPYSIKKFDVSMVLIDDCYADSDFSTGRFVNLQLGENKISFSHEGSENLNVVVEGLIKYESV